jgi:hypothetical protein
MENIKVFQIEERDLIRLMFKTLCLAAVWISDLGIRAVWM